MATISRLSVSLVANPSGLKKGLKSARASVKRFTGQIFNLKSAIVGAIGVGSMGAIAKSSVAAFQVQEQAVASFDASIISMKRNTKGLSQQIQKLATQIQHEGVIGDEAILQGASFLSTYGDITDKMLPRTIRVMADLAAKTGGSTTNAAKLLGKASMGLVGALSIAGISLSDATKESKDFGDILTEIEQQVGGINKVLGSTASGGIKQFNDAVGDIKEKIGAVITTAFSPWLRHIGSLLGDVSFDAKLMGQQLRDSMLDAAKSMAPLADALAGIQLVWKTLKLAAVGFGAAVLKQIQLMIKAANYLPGLFGIDFISDTTVSFIDDALNSQINKIRDLKSEISNFATDITTDLPSAKLKVAIDKFALDTEVTAMKQRLGLINGGNFAEKSAAPKGVLERLEIGKDPQMETQTEVLRDIRDVMSRFGKNSGVAIAG
ncbi:MAG: hypothetical protein GY938_17845 [Ketobacter sp.]|nr:hypothetical protein [Ketobacter sp.]